MTDDKAEQSGATSAEFPAAEAVIESFGGIRPAAAKLGVPVTTVQGWKSRGRIPDNRHEMIRQAAEELGIDLGPAQSVEPAGESPASGSVPAAGTSARMDGSEPAEEIPAAEAPSDVETGDDTGDQRGTESEARQADDSGEEERVETHAAPAAQNPVTLNWIAMGVAVVALATSAMLIFRPDIVDRLTDGRLSALGGQGGEAVGQLKSEIGEVRQQSARLASEQEKLARELAARGKTGGAESMALGQKLEDFSARLDVLDEELGATRDRMGALEESQSGISELGESRLQNAVSSLRGELETLEGKVTALGNRKADASQPGVFGARTAVLLAVGQLEAAVRSGAPYRSALDRARKISEMAPRLLEAMAPLETRANTGIPTVERLEERLEDLEAQLAAGPEPSGGRGVLEGIWARLKSTVSLRRIDKDSMSPITRTERALAKGDLEAALQATEGFNGAVGEWRRAVRSRLAAEATLKSLSELAMEIETSETEQVGGAPDAAGKQ